MTQNNLGNTLAMLGDREGGTERLEQAVVAYRAVLEEYTRERMPPHWATTQHNLGNVLAMLGTRKSSVPLLEQAIEAYRSALVERPRESAPLNWADSQRGLAGALASLATRRPGRRLGLPCNAPTGPRAYGRRVGLYARRCGGVSGRLQSLLVGNDRAADQRARDDAGGHAKRGGLIRMKADPMLTLVTKVTDGGVTVKSMLPAAFVPFTGG
jgi:tetratricopeptide (TPR) repeat protein